MYHQRYTRLLQQGTVMTFVCQMCGECCSTMGEIIVIGEQLGGDEFRIRLTPTMEERTVRLDPDKRDLFYRDGPRSPMACPFLRELGPGRKICTVHQSRTDLCRQYSCYRILVLDEDGKRAGRVMEGSRHFTASDPALHELWQRDCLPLNIPDDEQWEMRIEQVLTCAGYRVLR
jgi:Fe-S-cluster containining protein